MTTLIALALFLTALVVAGGSAPADASGVKIIIGGPTFVRPPAHQHPKPGVGKHPIIVWPHPVHIVRPQRCLVPGSWAYAWVPQSYEYNVWTEGRYSSDGLWVEGHWEPRVSASGYYQPYWIPERWTYC